MELTYIWSETVASRTTNNNVFIYILWIQSCCYQAYIVGTVGTDVFFVGLIFGYLEEQENYLWAHLQQPNSNRKRRGAPYQFSVESCLSEEMMQMSSEFFNDFSWSKIQYHLSTLFHKIISSLSSVFETPKCCSFALFLLTRARDHRSVSCFGIFSRNSQTIWDCSRLKEPF